MSKVFGAYPAAPNAIRRRTGQALLVAAVLLGPACTDDNPEATPISFTSYAEAQEAMSILANEHSDAKTVPQEVREEMERTLEAAVPVFRNDVRERVAKLTRLYGPYGNYNDMDALGHPQTYQVITFPNRDGDLTTTISLEGRNGRTESLSVIFNGRAWDEILYAQDDTDKKIRIVSSLAVKGNAVTALSEYYMSGDSKSPEDYFIRLEKFADRFEAGSNTPSAFEFTEGLMEQAHLFLTSAEQVVENSTA